MIVLARAKRSYAKSARFVAFPSRCLCKTQDCGAFANQLTAFPVPISTIHCRFITAQRHAPSELCPALPCHFMAHPFVAFAFQSALVVGRCPRPSKRCSSCAHQCFSNARLVRAKQRQLIADLFFALTARLSSILRITVAAPLYAYPIHFFSVPSDSSQGLCDQLLSEPLHSQPRHALLRLCDTISRSSTAVIFCSVPCRVRSLPRSSVPLRRFAYLRNAVATLCTAFPCLRCSLPLNRSAVLFNSVPLL